ncbi:glutathione S-transferase family protein [Motilimonas pumila]|nr:glutathione S-transferase family protein [Motilimonas pumila]
MTDVTIYGQQFSNFVRSVELACLFTDVTYQIGHQHQGKDIEWKSEQHLAIHPFSRMPVLLQGDFVLAESVAICQYLALQDPQQRIIADDPQQQAVQLQWALLAAKEIDRGIIRRYLLELVMPTGENGKPDFARMMRNKPDALAVVAVVERQLSKHKYIAGDSLSFADFILLPTLHYSLRLQNDLSIVTPQSIIRDYVASALTLPGVADILNYEGL